MPPFHAVPGTSSEYFSFLAIAILEGLAIHTWQYRKEPGALWQVWLQASKGLWLFVLVVAIRSTTIQQEIIFLQIETVLSVVVCYQWFRFTAEISGFERWMSMGLIRAIGGTMGFISVVILTNKWHGLIWNSFRMEGGVFHAPRSAIGISLAMPIYLLSAFTVWINIRWALRNVGLRRRQAWIFLLPSPVSWAGHILCFVLGTGTFAPRAMGFCLSSLIMIWGFHRWRFYSILPLAKEVLINGMEDALMVLDDEGYIVELNAPAKAIFAGVTVSVGSTFEEARKEWPEMFCPAADDSVSVWEVQRRQGDVTCYYRTTTSSLRSPAGNVLGRVMVFKDVSREKLQQVRIVKQERSLAMMAERERLGRELHGGQGQVWSYFSLTTQMLRTMLARQKYEQAEQELTRLYQVVQEMNTGFRESIYGLQTSVAAGLIHALEKQLEWYRKYCELDVRLELRCDWRQGMLTPGTEAQLLRIVQESMVNIRKSAQASRARVILERVDGDLLVSVEDNGRGFDVTEALASSGHHGLNIMRERAEEAGGTLNVVSQPGCGTVVWLSIPLVGEGWDNCLQ
jgi:signal transduction histidine kinase